MNLWNAPESLFAPLIAAVPPGTAWAGFGNALISAQQSVPRAVINYRITRRFKFVHEQRDRTLVWQSSDETKTFNSRIYLIDLPRERTLNHLGPCVLWEVGLSHLRSGLCQPAVPEVFDSAILQISKFRLSNGTIAGAPQLALLRHLWAENVRSASPEAIVFGGQHHWDDSWWAEILPTEEAK